MQVVNQVTGAELVLDYHLIPGRTVPVQCAAFVQHNDARRAKGKGTMALISDERGTLVLRKAWARKLRRICKRVPSMPSFDVGLSPARARPILLQEVCDLRHRRRDIEQPGRTHHSELSRGPQTLSTSRSGKCPDPCIGVCSSQPHQIPGRWHKTRRVSCC